MLKSPERDFKILLNEWLQQTPGTKVHSLADVIKFNRDHAEQELPPRRTYALLFAW